MTGMASPNQQSQHAAAKLLRVQWLMLVAVAAVAGIGTATLYSVGGGSMQPWAEAHAVRFLAALVLVMVMGFVPLHLWMHVAYPTYFVGLILLALVPLVGVEALGARRWISFAGTSFQPSELVKVGLVLALARYYQQLPADRVSWPRAVLPPLLAIAIPVALTLKQPDLGTALLLCLLGLTLMFLAGVSWAYFLAGAAAALASLPIILRNLHGYQLKRLEVFLDPGKDPLGAGYHIAQSKIALAAGGMSGKGYMLGTQSRLQFLPESHTDFILAMFGEEWGFAGAIALLALFASIVAMGLVMALRAHSSFARLLIGGFVVMLFLYAAINVAMVTGVAPVVGVPLPLVSYGGTSMMTLMVSLGLAMSAHVHARERLRRDEFAPW
jgi:rod shape determining protein RodA